MSWLSKGIGWVGKQLGGGGPQPGMIGPPPGFNPGVPSSPLVKTPTGTGSIFDGYGIGQQPAGSPGTYRTDGLPGIDNSRGWKDYMLDFAEPLINRAGTAFADRLFGDEPTNTPLTPNTANPGGAPAGSPTGSVGGYAQTPANSVDWGVQLGSGGMSSTTLLLAGGVLFIGAVMVARGGR